MKEKIRKYAEFFNKTKSAGYKTDKIDPEKIIESLIPKIRRIKDKIVNTDEFARMLIEEKKKILFEGAQATMLDIDFGTYPYVTSSHPISLYAFAGSGIPPFFKYNVIGITKAYATRVGNGPFPTKMDDKTDRMMRERGGEYGATTGRVRDCGWLDLFALRYAVFLNRCDEIIVTKLDILANVEKIRICTAYEYNGKILKAYPDTNKILSNVTPVYRTINGWTDKDIVDLKKGRISRNIGNFIKILREETNTKISHLAVGPERDDIVRLEGR
jgi:adenylosuccinate synthase